MILILIKKKLKLKLKKKKLFIFLNIFKIFKNSRDADKFILNHSCFALVKNMNYLPHSMKYSSYSSRKREYPLYISNFQYIAQHNSIVAGDDLLFVYTLLRN